jgi:hypothetical protein
MFEFEAFPKIHRLKQSVVVTEKIDGSNGQIAIFALDNYELCRQAAEDPNCLTIWPGKPDMPGQSGEVPLAVYAGSRTRWVLPETERKAADNFGFAQWVDQNIHELIKLGPGRHFGEWYGAGIQCGYGLSMLGPDFAAKPRRHFALFNTARWGSHNPNTPTCCQVVPVLAEGQVDIEQVMDDLRVNGSRLVPGFMEPEGIVVYYAQSRSYAKRTFVGDAGKWVANGQ